MTTELRSQPDDDAFAGYAPPEERPPFIPYAIFATTFNAGLLAFLVAARKGRFELPERVGATDIVLMAAASQKLGRVIAKDKVTSFLRAPFKRYEGGAGQGQLEESTRGNGVRRAIGELIGCPWCLALWLTAPMAASLVVAPRETRFVATIFATLSAADFLSLAFKAAESTALEGDPSTATS